MTDKHRSTLGGAGDSAIPLSEVIVRGGSKSRPDDAWRDVDLDAV
jgi:hypothetical protein